MKIEEVFAYLCVSDANAAFQASRRAASVSTAISASSSWTSWNDAIGLPNC